MKIEMISLNKLVPSPANMRKTGAKPALTNSRPVSPRMGCCRTCKSARRQWQVRGRGGRAPPCRPQAAREGKTIAKDAEIACNVLDEADAAEISLAENIMRLPMHPADQYEAFKALADQGKGPEEIAARFGCSPAVIQQRLKLAGVSPSLLDALPERGDEPRSVDGVHRQRRSRRAGEGMGRASRMEPASRRPSAAC